MLTINEDPILAGGRAERVVRTSNREFPLSGRSPPVAEPNRKVNSKFRTRNSDEASPVRLRFLVRTDLRPKPDQLKSHRDDLVRERSFRIGAEAIKTPKALKGPLYLRQRPGDRRWDNVRIVHMFR
jgi:hypothetical protein